MRFNYEGFDALSCVKRGWIEANSVEEASGKLREMKIFVQNIAPDGVPAKNILPDERASEANFPADSGKKQEADEDGGFVRIYEPSKAGAMAEPTGGEGRAKVYNPFAQKQNEPPAGFRGPPGPIGIVPQEWSAAKFAAEAAATAKIAEAAKATGVAASNWEQLLAFDLRIAREVAQAVEKLSDGSVAESNWKTWAAQTLVERAAQDAALRISRQRSS